MWSQPQEMKRGRLSSRLLRYGVHILLSADNKRLGAGVCLREPRIVTTQSLGSVLCIRKIGRLKTEEEYNSPPHPGFLLRRHL